MTALPSPITSRENPLFKELRKLAQDGSAYRKTGRVWIEGEHLCAACAQKGLQAEILLISDQNTALVGIFPQEFAIKSIVIADALMKEISSLESPAWVGAILQLPMEQSIDPQAPTVILDRLQDPGNVGSILRSSAAFGYTQIIALKGSVALWSPKVLRAGMGAHFSLRLIEGASLEDLQALQRPLAVTSSHRGKHLHELLQKRELKPQETSRPTAKNTSKNTSLKQVNWVLGHEGQGVSQALEESAGLHVRIAQPGGEESLNVAAAAAIVLHASGTAP
jgi:RNA methyltransferase, TrmH family